MNGMSNLKSTKKRENAVTAETNRPGKPLKIGVVSESGTVTTFPPSSPGLKISVKRPSGEIKLDGPFALTRKRLLLVSIARKAASVWC